MSAPTQDRAGDAARERDYRDEMERRGERTLAMSTCPHGEKYPVGGKNPCAQCAEEYRAAFARQVEAANAKVTTAVAELTLAPPTPEELAAYLTEKCRQADGWISPSDEGYPTMDLIVGMLPFRGGNAERFVAFRAGRK